MSRRELSLAPPPRSVPALLRLHVLFGGFLSQFGWAFFAFGMIFFWVFVGNSEAVALLDFGGYTQFAEATVTGIEETGMSENEETIYAIVYRFDFEGQSFDGRSYSPDPPFSPNEKVEIQYRPDNPRVSRIPGLRSKPFGYLVLLVAIFPLVGLALVIVGLKKGFRGVRLLRTGIVGWGTLKSKEVTGTEINEQPVYALTFEFEDDRGMKHNVEARSHQPEKLEDEAEEPVLYDPAQPSYAVVFDSLPGAPGIEQGRLRVRQPMRALISLILPTLSLGGHGLVALAAILA